MRLEGWVHDRCGAGKQDVRHMLEWKDRYKTQWRWKVGRKTHVGLESRIQDACLGVKSGTKHIKGGKLGARPM